MRGRDLQILRGILDRRGDFGHRQHLELAWSYLAVYSVRAAQDAVRSAIRHVAALHGAPDRYHETITLSWLALVAIHRADSDAGSFDEFIAHNPSLLDRSLLRRHFSAELIASDEARARWVEPDLRRLPLSAC